VTQLGKSVRLNRLRHPDSGRILTVAVDHAPSYGILHGLEHIQAVVDQVAGARPDAMVMMKGVAERCFGPHAGDVALMLKGSSLSPFHPEHDVVVSSVDDAVALGADAIAMAFTVGSDEQPELLRALAAIVRRAGEAGMPVVVHSYPCGRGVPEDERYTAERVGYAARLAMEVGVDIVKTYYTGSPESFSRVVDVASPALVVAAGGPRLTSDEDVLRMARGVVDAGAAGITFGRNIWQSDDPVRLIGALKEIVHR
jgi:DhnA family fructose-bisphosphate aldolase class Ia